MKVCEQNTRVFLLDDDELFRDSLKNLLAANGIKVDPHASIEEFQHFVEFSSGGCILLDVRQSDLGGLKLQRELKSVAAIWPIVYLSECADIQIAVEAMKLGAIDFLTKPVRELTLLDSLRRAMTIAESNFNLFQERKNLHSRLAQLTSRELQVLKLLVRGWLNKQIAASLEVSLRTIESRRAAIQKKLELKSIFEIMWQIRRFDFELTSLPLTIFDYSHRMGEASSSPSTTQSNAKVKNVINTDASDTFTHWQTELLSAETYSTE